MSGSAAPLAAFWSTFLRAPTPLSPVGAPAFPDGPPKKRLRRAPEVLFLGWVLGGGSTPRRER
eukprot:15433542-Alexandrium_andersonii.AAC.1